MRDSPPRETQPERRRGPDLWVKTLAWLAIAGWLAVLAALYLVGEARPEMATMFDHYFDLKLRSTWDLEKLGVIPYLMLLGMLASFLGLVVNIRRSRRASDSWRLWLILPGFLCLIGITVSLIYG